MRLLRDRLHDGGEGDVVEGFNEVIGLDNVGVPTVAVMSNRMTEMQGDKVAMWAEQLASGKVTLMFDCEPSGRDGAKEALWFFAERQLDVRLAWTPWMHSGKFVGNQPENLSREEWETIIGPAMTRHGRQEEAEGQERGQDSLIQRVLTRMALK